MFLYSQAREDIFSQDIEIIDIRNKVESAMVSQRFNPLQTYFFRLRVQCGSAGTLLRPETQRPQLS